MHNAQAKKENKMGYCAKPSRDFFGDATRAICHLLNDKYLGEALTKL
jgi:hypothetical protein